MGCTSTKTPNINKILREPRYSATSKYGAHMGRRNQSQGEPEALYLQRLQMVGGDYDTGGDYWGGWSESCGGMWCAFTTAEATENEFPVMVFVRAKSRQEAKQLVLEELGEEWEFKS